MKPQVPDNFKVSFSPGGFQKICALVSPSFLFGCRKFHEVIADVQSKKRPTSSLVVSAHAANNQTFLVKSNQAPDINEYAIKSKIVSNLRLNSELYMVQIISGVHWEKKLHFPIYCFSAFTDHLHVDEMKLNIFVLATP